MSTNKLKIKYFRLKYNEVSFIYISLGRGMRGSRPHLPLLSSSLIFNVHLLMYK